MRTSILSNLAEIDAARSLLYRVYHVEQGWSPRVGNPSEQRIEELDDGRRGFVDAYDAHASWIGTFVDDELVGCVRLAGVRPSDGKLEAENYCTLPAPLRQLAAAGRLLEGNRLAVAADRRGSLEVVASLLDFGVDILETARAALLVCVGYRMGLFLDGHLGTEPTGVSFRYAPDDPETVQAYLRVPNPPSPNSERRSRRIRTGADRCGAPRYRT